jgi:ABC-type antimicrobial peptide transport system permease subunit
MDFAFDSSFADPIGALADGKYIMLTNTLRNIYGVNEGDSVILKIFGYDGVYREVAYRIIGFFDDEMTKLGRYALISHKNFEEDFRARAFSSLYISADSEETALNSIKNAYRDKQLQLTTVKEDQKRAWEESRMTISAMQWISNLSATTGVMGMLFIMLLSFQSRTNELSIYGAIGLERGGIGIMLFMEMMFSGAGGVAAGAGIGALIGLIALPRLVYSLQIAMSIHFHPAILGRACGFGMAICMAAGVIGAVSYAKATPIGGLRHE